jgi:hypothetical protein
MAIVEAPDGGDPFQNDVAFGPSEAAVAHRSNDETNVSKISE